MSLSPYSKASVGIVVQARMVATRLPGKMLLPILGRPVLWHLIQRLKTVRDAALVIATTDQKSDDSIARLCEEEKVRAVRGSMEDVLSRYIAAAKRYDFQVIVRITGDCPLMDPEMLQTMIQNFKQNDWDYYSNLRPRSFPRGLDCEIFSRELLNRAYEKRLAADILEYVVIPYVNREKDHLKIGNYEGRQNNSLLRWTLDEPADYELIKRVYESLYPQNPYFSLANMLNLIDNDPELRSMNAHVKQKSI